MAHAKLNLQRMFDWIEGCVARGNPLPTDANIMQYFGFESPESARTLLAELADAGRISIHGYGAERTIEIGRVKCPLPIAARPTPAVRTADPAVDSCLAKISAIIARGPSAGAARAVQASAALKEIGTKRVPIAKAEKAKPIVTPAPAPPKKEAPVMPAKSLQLPASAIVAIDAVETYAKSNDVSMGAAAAHLIEGGLTAPARAVPATVEFMSIDQLLTAIKTRFEDILNLPDRSDEVAALTTRAEAAERKLEAMRAALA